MEIKLSTSEVLTDQGKELRDVLIEVVENQIKINSIKQSLNIDNLKSILLTDNMQQEIDNLCILHSYNDTISMTKNGYSLVAGKALSFKTDNGYSHYIILSYHIFTGYSELIGLQEGLHLLNHELIHIHDNNTMVNSGIDISRKKNYSHYDNCYYPIAEKCWSEYYANFHSSLTATPNNILALFEIFENIFSVAENTINQSIKEYRTNSNLEKVLTTFSEKSNTLLANLSYLLGYAHGKDNESNDILNKLKSICSGSSLYETLIDFNECLKTMNLKYDKLYTEDDYLTDLVKIIKKHHALFGMIFYESEHGLGVDIPLHPKNTPL